MRASSTRQFDRSYAAARAHIQKAFDQKLEFLLKDLRHPSLRAKKYDEANEIWQARVTREWRFYFQIKGDVYYLINIRSHPK